MITIKKFFSLIAVLMSSITVQGQVYDLSTPQDLLNMQYDLGGDYTLANDIDMEGVDFEPFGEFTGTLDGQGHVIRNLYYDESGTSSVALFSSIREATVTNLGIEGAYFVGDQNVAAIAGNCYGGTIDKCYVANSYIEGRDHVGAIAGNMATNNSEDALSTISNCLSDAKIHSRISQAGGLVGVSNGGTLTKCLFSGTVYCGSSNVAGLVSLLDSDTYPTVLSDNLSAPAHLYGMLTDTYLLGSSYSDIEARLIHTAWRSCTFSNNYAIASTNIYALGSTDSFEGWSKISGTGDKDDRRGETVQDATAKTKDFYAGTLGWDFDNTWKFLDGAEGKMYPVLQWMNAPLVTELFDLPTDISSLLYSDGSENIDLSIIHSSWGEPLTYNITSGEELVNYVAEESKIYAGDENGDYAGSGDVEIEVAVSSDLASLFNFTGDVTFTFYVGKIGETIEIATADEFLKIARNSTGNYKLTADIDMQGVDFEPFGEFTGTLDGQGHVIKNLYYNNSGTSTVALFSAIREAIVTNLGIEGAYFVGDQNVAAIAGNCYGGTIDKCYVANSYIEGNDHVGAIAGNMATNNSKETVSTISNCLSDAKIYSRSYQAGGLVGVSNGGTLTKCLFSGTVYCGSSNVAGLVSLLDSDTYPTVLSDNLSAPAHLYGMLTDTAWNGGTATSDIDARLMHVYGRSCTFSNNYAIASTYIDSFGAKISGAGDKDDVSGETVQDATAKTKDFYAGTLGWDFDNTWKFFDGAEGKMYPVLQWMNAPLVTEVFDLPSDVSLLYSDGSENLDLSTIHSSWGEPLTYNIISGEGLANYVAEENKIYAGDENGYYAGSGEVEVEVAVSSDLASLFNLTGDVTFTLYVGKSGEITEIATADDFLNIARNLAGNYRLTADIDMSGVEFSGIAVSGTPFSGTIDGDGHKVKNLHVAYDTGENVGIFGETSGATFKNVAFENFYVSASYDNCDHVGFIGSATSTTFESSAFTGYVYGHDHAAILAGDGDGSRVNNCYVWGAVDAYSQVGGFFGCTLENGATVTNSYFNGSLATLFRGWTGGFIGLIDKEGSEVTITNCASIGDCSATGDGTPHTPAPFIAGNGSGNTAYAVITFSDNICNSNAVMTGDGTAWPYTNITANGGNVKYAAEYNLADMQTQSVYENIGWDFNDVWEMNTSNGYLFPVLKNLGYVDCEYVVITDGIGTPSVAADTGRYTVKAYGDKVVVSGLSGAARITVANIAGQTVSVNTVTGATAEVSLPYAGMYIVSVACNGSVQSYKVINK